MSEWKRLRDWNSSPDLPALCAVVEVIRDGFLVSIRYLQDGIPDDIVGYRRDATGVGVGRTVDVAFRRAMDGAEQGYRVDAERGARLYRKR